MQDANRKQDEIELLKSQNESLQKTIDSLQSKNEFLIAEHEKLSKLLASHLLGKRHEKHISSSKLQGWLPFESEEEYQQAKAEAEVEAERVVEEAAQAKQQVKKKPRKESLPEHLPIVEKIVDVSESDRSCSEHGALKYIGFDSTKTLVHEPAKLYVIETKYLKYACSCCSAPGVVSSERPTSLVEGNKYDTSVAATIVQAKYDLHMPIYRQQDLFAGSGWQPARSTLLNILRQVAFVIEPFMAYMTGRVQGDSIVGIDDTSCRMLIPREPLDRVSSDAKLRRLADKIAEAREKGQDSILGKMWAYRGGDKAPYNIFDFRVSRHRDGPEEFFKTSRCYVQGDCFSGNKAVVLESNGRLTFVACWAHARRKVFESSTYPNLRERLLELIQALYDVNAQEQSLSVEARTELRKQRSLPILHAMKKWIDMLGDQEVLPKSDFAESLRYIRNHWSALVEYTNNGRIPMDNNLVEQLMKQVALGRKAWLFVGNLEAGERSAMLMSLVSSAKRHDLDVWLYIKEVLDRLLAGQTEYESLLPDVWKRTNPTAIREYRVQERRDKADRKQLDRARRLLAAKQKK